MLDTAQPQLVGKYLLLTTHLQIRSMERSKLGTALVLILCYPFFGLKGKKVSTGRIERFPC